ncbi:MAG: beta-propeller domain-containing protein [Sedimentisphaerales bacterium]|nr:beta-propeller domain-containing protein [Sedimentisphaerales bacterium]
MKNVTESSRHKQPARLLLEPLEARQLLDAAFSGGTWVIFGDPGGDPVADTIRIEPDPLDADFLQAVINDVVVDRQVSTTVRRIKVFAGAGDDVVTVQADLTTPVQLWGQQGDDLLEGAAGPDRLIGGAGSDTLNGNGGDDRLRANRGNDQCDGGAGDDRLWGGAGVDLVSGGPGCDRLGGGAGGDLLYASDGEDHIRRAAADTLIPEQVSAAAASTVGTADECLAWYIDTAVASWQSLLGEPWQGYEDIFDAGLMPIYYGLDLYSDAQAAADVSFETAGDYSQTNVQYVGVDEADIVKTDGQHIYLLADGRLTILAAEPAGTLAVVSQTPIEGQELGMYRYQDRVTVLSRLWSEPVLYEDPQAEWNATGQISLALDFAILPMPIWSSQVKVTILDVSSPADPQSLQQTYLDGYLVSSRAIGDRVYVVTRDYPILPQPQAVETPEGDLRYETESEYRQRLGQQAAEFLPGYTSERAGPDGVITQSGLFLQDSHIYLPEDPGGADMLTVCLFTVQGDAAGPAAITSVLAAGGTVYASSENLYVVSHGPLAIQLSDPADDATWLGPVNASLIYQFDLTAADAIPLAATGWVPGQILNQFSLDEYQGTLRIATTTFTPQQANHLFVLAPQAGELKVVGSLTDLALGEHLEAVRFGQDRAFLVTFRTVDPLFAVDLTTPQRPLVAGQLKLPGFSRYLHPIDANLLIGLGYDADENGLNRALQVSLFDVSDLGNPRRLDAYTFDDYDLTAQTEALWDHHAFSYFADDQTLALPVSYGWLNPAALTVLAVDAQEGFDFLGAIEHDTDIRRSLRIEDRLYAISDQAASVHDLAEPEIEFDYVTF